MKITLKIAVFGWVWLDMPCHAQTSQNTIVKSNYPEKGSFILGQLLQKWNLVKWNELVNLSLEFNKPPSYNWER